MSKPALCDPVQAKPGPDAGCRGRAGSGSGQTGTGSETKRRRLLVTDPLCAARPHAALRRPHTLGTRLSSEGDPRLPYGCLSILSLELRGAAGGTPGMPLAIFV